MDGWTVSTEESDEVVMDISFYRRNDAKPATQSTVSINQCLLCQWQHHKKQNTEQKHKN